MLIRDAEIDAWQPGGSGGRRVDVRCRDGHIDAIAPGLLPEAGEPVLDARGGALLPGLHDHHLHLFALAATSLSVACGPPAVCDRDALQAALASAPGSGWIRGTGYHESVAGPLDRRLLDALCPARPLRVQHDSGRTWYLNSPALAALGLPARGDGELFRDDARLRRHVPSLDGLDGALQAAAGRLAACGVTGVTDASPSNDAAVASRLAALALPVRVHLLGGETLAGGALKILLDDCALPDVDALRARMLAAHAAGRPVAVHCVSRTELVFALAVLGEAGVLRGDRLEHASVTDDAGLELVAAAGVTVVTQPNLVAERGHRYLDAVDPADHPYLYRVRGFAAAGAPVAAGTDAPYGAADPWLAMRAAVARTTTDGRMLGAGEAVSPEQALRLFLGTPADPGGPPRRIAAGEPADLCLLRLPWRFARRRLLAGDVAATITGGRLRYRGTPT
jgi:predicted amidohydrolase YtcJ